MGTLPPEPHTSILDPLSSVTMEDSWHVATGDPRNVGWPRKEPGAQRPCGGAGVEAGGTQPGAEPALQQLRLSVLPSLALRASSLLCPQMGVQASCRDFLSGGERGRAKGKASLSECPGPAQWLWGRYLALIPNLLASEGRLLAKRAEGSL